MPMPSAIDSRVRSHAEPRASTLCSRAEPRAWTPRLLPFCAAFLAAGLLLSACADDAKRTESSDDNVETDAAAALSGDAGSDEVLHEDQGKGDGSDVIMIGDSWMSLGGVMTGIQGGVLKASGQPYRPYGIGGTTLLGGGTLAFLTPIPTQYENATKADPDVKTVIMTGGGNDILQSGLQADCQMKGDACAVQVLKILDRLSQLWAAMADNGVQDVVYILYATPQGENVDFALPDGDGVRSRCAKIPGPLRCHILETLDLVMGDIPDNIHPSQVASDRIGQAVIELMTREGIRR